MTSKAFEIAKMAVGVTTDATGEITTIDMTTDAIQEGAVNLFDQPGSGGITEAQTRIIAAGQAIALGS